MDLDIFVAVLTGLAVFVPFTIPWLEKKDKLKKTVYLIELIKTKDELVKLIEQVKDENSSPIILHKLEKNLYEIEVDINSSSSRFPINGFFIFISIEIFFIFSFFSNIIIQKSWESGLGFLEGFFAPPYVRIIMILVVIIIAYMTSSYISNKLSLKYRIDKIRFNNFTDKIKRIYLYNISMIAIFNIFLFVFGAIIYFFLKYSDDYISWY